MNLSKLKQSEYGWWAVASFTGAVIWSLPFLFQVGEQGLGFFLATVVIPALFVLGLVWGFYKPVRPWRWGIASILLFPVVDAIYFAVVFKTNLMLLMILGLKIPTYALMSSCVLMGAYLTAYIRKRIGKHQPSSDPLVVKNAAREHEGFDLLLAFTVGLISGVVAFLVLGKNSPLLMRAVVAIGIVMVIGLRRPHRVWLNAAIAALGIPVAVTLSIIIDMIRGIRHNLFPMEVLFTVVFGVVCAFAGVALGIALRSTFRKAQPVQIERTPSRLVWRSLVSVLLITIAVLFYKIISLKPDFPPQAGVQLGSELISKTVLISKPEIGDVTSIKLLPSVSDTGAAMVVAGEMGAMMISLRGQVKSLIKFDERMGKVVPVETKRKGDFEFVNTGGGWQPVSLISNTGKTIWKSPPKETPDEMATIDLDSDGVEEFVVGMNGHGGLKAYDRGGNELWTQPATNAFSVKSITENGSAEIIHTDGENIIIRSTNGDKLRILKLPFITFAIGQWFKEGVNPVIMGMADGDVQAFDLNGKRVGSLPIQHTGIDLSTATIEHGDDSFFVVVVSLRASSHLSALYIYDKLDTTVYYEIFQGREPTVVTVPAQNGNQNFLLVGGTDGTVTQYKLK